MNATSIQVTTDPSVSHQTQGGTPAMALDASRALEACRRAQADWADSSWPERIAALKAARAGLVDQAHAWARECARVRNRPVGEVLSSEILPLAEAVRFLERNARQILRPLRVPGSRFFPNPLRTAAEIHREPFGVVLIIAPSNYPLFLAGVQALQALTAGNGVMLKPGPGAAPLLERFGRMLEDCGFPASLLQVLPEDPELAGRMMDQGVDKLILTGSASTGRRLLSRLAPQLTPATMELSGCDAVFVRPDANLDLTTQALVFGVSLNEGATCIAPKRIFAAREIAAALEGHLSKALTAVEEIPISRAHAKVWQDLWPDASARGARLLSGRIDSNGDVMGPLLFAGLPRGHRLLREEFFAPVMSFSVVDHDSEAIDFAKDCPYALGASVFSRNETAARKMARSIPAGIVVINDMIAPTADARLPFGGRGQSGFGSTRGKEGLLDLTRPKVITTTPGNRRWHFAPLRKDDESLFQDLLILLHGRGMVVRGRALLRLLRTGIQSRHQD